MKLCTGWFRDRRGFTGAIGYTEQPLVWSPGIHVRFPSHFRECVLAVLLLNARNAATFRAAVPDCTVFFQRIGSATVEEACELSTVRAMPPLSPVSESQKRRGRKGVRGGRGCSRPRVRRASRRSFTGLETRTGLTALPQDTIVSIVCPLVCCF